MTPVLRLYPPANGLLSQSNQNKTFPNSISKKSYEVVKVINYKSIEVSQDRFKSCQQWGHQNLEPMNAPQLLKKKIKKKKIQQYNCSLVQKWTCRRIPITAVVYKPLPSLQRGRKPVTVYKRLETWAEVQFQCDNDSKHTTIATIEGMRLKHFNVLEWTCQIPCQVSSGSFKSTANSVCVLECSQALTLTK